MPRKPVPALKPSAVSKRARDRVRGAVRVPESAPSWYRIEAKGDEAVIYLHDEIGYWGRTSAEFVEELRGHRGKPLRVHINSPGGDVFDALAIYNALAAHPKTVTTHIDALAASAASFIALAGDKVMIESNAMIMVHDAHGLGVGNAEELREYAALLGQCSDLIAGIYAEKAGGTVAEWRQVMAKDRWYGAEEALNVGLVDEIAKHGDDFTDAAASLIRQPFAARMHRDQSFAELAKNITSPASPEWTQMRKGLTR